MKNRRNTLYFSVQFRSLLVLLGLFSLMASAGCADNAEALSLWYEQPAKGWTEALPVGNGRLGAMVFGGIQAERIQLNEESVWAGPPVPDAPQGAYEALVEARKLIFEEKYADAERVIAGRFLGPRIAPRSHQTLGDLRLELKLPDAAPTNYRRDLNLDTAIAQTQFEVEGVIYTRHIFSSAPDDVLVVSMTASRPAALNLNVRLDRPADFETVSVGDNTLAMFGQARHDGKHKGVRFHTLLRADVRGGTCTPDGNTLAIADADSALLLLTAATDYNKNAPDEPLTDDLSGKCAVKIQKAIAKGFDSLKKAHLEDHRRLFRRVELDLGGAEAAAVPTDNGLPPSKPEKDDPPWPCSIFSTAAIFYRHLRPAICRNLQGIWNEHIAAPWNADYHLNVNLQMNYWPAEVANLSECHEPFFDYIEAPVPSARKTAQPVYRARGFVAHVESDVWRWTTPKRAHPMGKCALAAHGAPSTS
jgi:alpha-L-fucosidase 2